MIQNAICIHLQVASVCGAFTVAPGDHERFQWVSAPGASVWPWLWLWPWPLALWPVFLRDFQSMHRRSFSERRFTVSWERLGRLGLPRLFSLTQCLHMLSFWNRTQPTVPATCEGEGFTQGQRALCFAALFVA